MGNREEQDLRAYRRFSQEANGREVSLQDEMKAKMVKFPRIRKD